MPYDPSRHHRRSIRLKGYDYSQPGGYFITIVVKNRKPILGSVVDGVFHPSRYGHLVHMVLTALPKHYPYLQLDQFVLMPDHIHAIFILLEEPRTRRTPAPKRHSVTEVIRGFKTESARKINRLRKTQGTAVWKRNYYERIIRNQRALHAIRRYIIQNPLKWQIKQDRRFKRRASAL
ncbi:MAG: transposase [Caldilineales bacterium]